MSYQSESYGVCLGSRSGETLTHGSYNVALGISNPVSFTWLGPNNGILGVEKGYPLTMGGYQESVGYESPSLPNPLIQGRPSRSNKFKGWKPRKATRNRPLEEK